MADFRRIADADLASVPIPKFASVCRALGANFGIEKDTSKSIILVPLLNPKFASVPAAKSCELRVRGTSVPPYPVQAGS